MIETGTLPRQHRQIWRRQVNLEWLLYSGVYPTRTFEYAEGALLFWIITALMRVLRNCGRLRSTILLPLFGAWLSIQRAARSASHAP